MLSVLFSPRYLFVLAVFSLFSLPSFADASSSVPGTVVQKGKAKKGDAPPRPRPKPGPRDGDDDN